MKKYFPKYNAEILFNLTSAKIFITHRKKRYIRIFTNWHDKSRLLKHNSENISPNFAKHGRANETHFMKFFLCQVRAYNL